MTNDRLLELVIKGLPHPERIQDINSTSECDAIRFTWRGKHLRVSHNLTVEEFDGHFLRGTEIACLVQMILKEVSRGEALKIPRS